MELENNGATAEVEKIESEVIEQPKSMDDTIRETLQSLRDKGSTLDTSGAAPEDHIEKAQRLRDTQGKFSGKTPIEIVDKAAPVAPVAPPTPDPTSAAPNTWKKEAAEKWALIPPEARAEIARREADIHKGIEQYRSAAGFGQTMERAIQPYAATINGLGMTADRAVGELMANDHVLRYGTAEQKQAKAIGLLKSYGIDVAGLAAPTAEPQYVDPTVAQLQKTVQEQQQWITNQTQQGQQAASQALDSEIATFAADPKHSHFEHVQGHMAALLQAGIAKDMPDAYEQAVMANPQTRALVLAEQQAAALKEKTKTAQAAKNAASVNTPRRTALPSAQPIGSMDETIRSTLRNIQGR